MRQKLEGRVAELERRLAEQGGEADSAGQDTAGEVRGTQSHVFFQTAVSFLPGKMGSRYLV